MTKKHATKTHRVSSQPSKPKKKAAPKRTATFEYLSVFEGERGQTFLLSKKTTPRSSSLVLFVSEKRGYTESPKRVTLVTKSGRIENISQCDSFSVGKTPSGYFMSYVKRGARSKSRCIAGSKNGLTWKVLSEERGSEGAIVLSGTSLGGTPILSRGFGEITVFTTHKKRTVPKWESCIATSRDDWYDATSRTHFFDHAPIRPMGSGPTSKGLLIVYDASFNSDGRTHLQVGCISCAVDDPRHVLWRSEVPIWGQSSDEQRTEPLGVVVGNEQVSLWWNTERDGVVTVTIPNPFHTVSRDETSETRLARHEGNPIMSPRPGIAWERDGVFNPAALYDGDAVHIVYRAVGSDGTSTIGYASSKDGVTINERLEWPMFAPTHTFDAKSPYTPYPFARDFSGGGWGGCEDPKITRIGDTIYMTYVAFNGWEAQRIALTSIPREDFLAKRFHKWSRPKLISRSGEVNKSGCLFPEKVGGKFVVSHRVFPHILMDFLDSLDFTDERTLLANKTPIGKRVPFWHDSKHPLVINEPQKRIPVRPHGWDSRKVSVGATPIKTEFGWLVIYHATDDRDGRNYKIGAMLLDANDPSKILRRTQAPILTPRRWYEHDWKPGVVYPSGAIVKDGTLFVYYGGGDKHVCVATAPFDDFMRALLEEHDAPLTAEPIRILR